MKRSTLVVGPYRIETYPDTAAGGRVYICCDGKTSLFCSNRKEVLAFIKWPAKTPGGDAIRQWLDEQQGKDEPVSHLPPVVEHSDTHRLTTI
jgi:hypothetical protein